MRFLTASIVIGSLILIGALPAAGQSALTPGAVAPVRLAAGGDSEADRTTYAQKARDEMQEWQRKLHDFGETAEAKGKEAGKAADEDLNEAWTKAEAASRRLQTAGTDGWESAKASFEKASHDLSETWHKSHPDDK